MNERFDLTAAQHRALDIVTEVAKEKGVRPFLVGGPVRDLLLGRPSLDVDLTLEEGSSVLARALARHVDGRVRSFPQFLTYKVIADGLPEIDIATARRERYRAPGALPVVEAGKLRDDLLRRDFSVNAIALDVTDGTIHDPVGGDKDLREGVIRVLHDRSFIDDPTRILRAIRLSTRLGFTIEPLTAAWMREAIEGKALESVSRERIWRELFLAMDEDSAPAVLTALDEQGVLSAIIGSRLSDEARTLVDRVRNAVTARPDLDRHILYTGALLRGIEAPAPRLEGSGFSQKRTRSIIQIASELPRFEEALAGAQSDRHRFRLLKSVSPEMRSIIAAERPAEGEHVARFEEYQKFKLTLRGNDLELPGGPHVARALERTREAVFTGEIPADQARTFAREMAMKYLKREQERPQPEPK
jgi:tRNA nucleotidyltransferase (CCA-adding enzyme)